MQIVEFDNYTKIIADPGKVIIKNSFHFAVDSPHVVLQDDSLDDYSEISRVEYMNSLDSRVQEYGEPNYHDIYPGSEFPEDEAAFIPEVPAEVEEPEEEEIEEPIEEEEPTDDEEDYEYYEDDESDPELDIEPSDDGDDSDEGVSEEEPSEDSEEASEEDSGESSK